MVNFNLDKKAPSSLLGILSLCMGLALAAVLSVQPSHALLTYNIFETTDGNVVVQADGKLDLPISQE